MACKPEAKSLISGLKKLSYVFVNSINHHLTVEVPFEGQCQNVEVNQNNSL